MISLAQKENGGRHKRIKRTQGLIAFPIVGSSLFSTLIPPLESAVPMLFHIYLGTVEQARWSAFQSMLVPFFIQVLRRRSFPLFEWFQRGSTVEQVSSLAEQHEKGEVEK